MSFIKTGKCNQCGECCGFPRKTDFGQNNPWPLDWPEALETWQKEIKEQGAPIFRITGHEDLAGSLYVNSRKLNWVWVKGHGLCKQNVDEFGFTSWDQRCPFLSEKSDDGTVPCLIYETSFHSIWDAYCNNVPPEKFTREELERWQKNCPSCSFEWVEE